MQLAYAPDFVPDFSGYEHLEPIYYDREHHPLSTDGMVVWPQDLPYHYEAAATVNKELGYQHAVVGIHPNQQTLDNGVAVCAGMVRVTIGGGWLSTERTDLGSYWDAYYSIKRADQEKTVLRGLFDLFGRFIRR